MTYKFHRFSGLSVLFHHKAEQYCDSVSSWAAACEATQPLPADIQSLETAIRTHQSLYEAMCQAYTEVSVHETFGNCNSNHTYYIPDKFKKSSFPPIYNRSSVNLKTLPKLQK